MASPAAGHLTEVGLIGFGVGGATFHAPFIASTPGLRLSAVMTNDPARRRALAKGYPDTRIVDTIDALLALTPQLDLIAISSPNASHFPLACAAMEAGKHVVVDKPFSATSAQARALGALAARVGKLAMPFHNRRWDGDFLTVQQLIREHTLGDIFRFESRFDRWRATPKPGWCTPDAPARAENIVHDIATHLVDQALVLFGPVLRVYAELTRRHPAIVTFDDAFIVLTHANGVRSHLYMSAMAGLSGPRMSVFGSRAAYVKHGLDTQEAVLRAGMRPDDAGYGQEAPDRWGTLGGPGVNEHVPTVPGAYPEFYKGVARAVREGAGPPVSVADAIAGLDIVEAAFLSNERNEVVSL